MAISWPGQKREQNIDKDSQNYEDDGIIRSTKTITAIKSSSKGSHDNEAIKIIIDEPAEEDVLDFQDYSKNLANIIRETDPKFAVGIFGKWGTGKSSLMRMIQKKLDEDSEKILTVWFDAWRYEREKYLAVIPFLRQIRIALENEREKNKKSGRWDKMKEATERTITAFVHSIELSFSVPGSPISGTIKPEEIANSWKSAGSTRINGEHIQFHEHVTDYLKEALDELQQENPGYRIVVFVDDLDRCTPEKALEVLESIKAFFDIRGIVYVIGMDSESINHIVKQKYGEDSNIEGIDYLEKIVQLPFQIPAWNEDDITKSISEIIKKGLGNSGLAKKFNEYNNKLLIVKAIEPNPRQIKRFINNIILANRVFSKPDKEIEIDKLIAIQALNFRRDWNRFLELITPNETRKDFFMHHYNPLKDKAQEKSKFIITKDALESFIKEESEANQTLPPEIISIFQEIINNYDTLMSFLNAGADKLLLAIETMDEYRRALDATKLKEVTSSERVRDPTVIKKDAELHFFAKEWAKAEELYNKLLDLEPSNFDAMIKRSRALINLYRFMEARSLYEKAFALKGKDPTKLSLIATAYAHVKEHEIARSFIEEALKLGENSIPVLYNAACVYSLLDCKEPALKYLKQVIDQDKSSYRKSKVLDDEDLLNIRDDIRFIELIRK